MLKYLL